MRDSLNEGYVELANAIVAQSIEDYIEAYGSYLYNRCETNKGTGRSKMLQKRKIKSLIEFFHSDYFSKLTQLDIDEVIKSLNEKIEHAETMPKSFKCKCGRDILNRKNNFIYRCSCGNFYKDGRCKL